MRVLFDALGLPPYGGARTSALGWIRSVVQEGAEDHFISLVSHDEPSLRDLHNLRQLSVPISSRFNIRIWAQIRVPQLVRTLGVDLVHFTKNLGCFLIPCPTVVTINDLTRLHYPEMFSRVDLVYWKTIQRALFREADRVIAISENTKQDILDFYHLPSEKIQVVYPSVGIQFQSRGFTAGRTLDVLHKYGIQPPYILSVGGMAVHKNVYAALCAYRSLLDRGLLRDITFVLVGERIHTHNDRRLFDVAARSGKERVQFTGVVEDEDLAAIYSGASLFVYPSLYEGFGLAPLEAMACGTPVLASRAGSLPEVLGDAAWLVEDPMDTDAIAAGMLKILTDSTTSERLRERGLENANRFSWNQTASQTLELYRQLVAS